MAFYTAYNILGELEQVNNKRKAVIYVSTGYDFDPFAEGAPAAIASRAAASRIRCAILIDEENPVLPHRHASPPTSICTS